MNDGLQNGIGGAIIGGMIVLGGMQVAVNDIDPITGESYEEIVTNPEKDIYYIFDVANTTEALWEQAHQKPETARYSLDSSKVILKFDIYEVPRTETYPEPMTHEQALEYLNDPINGFAEIEEVVKEEKDTKFTIDDNFIEP